MRGHQLYARLGAIGHTLPTAREQAAALGVDLKQLKFIRYRARKAGFDVGEMEADYGAKTARLAQFDAEMGEPGCGRCGLRGPHGCTSIEQFVVREQRYHPGPISPGGRKGAAP